MKNSTCCLLKVLLLVTAVDAFGVVDVMPRRAHSRTTSDVVALHMAGFGSSGTDSKKPKKETKLKPKAQWDRYLDLKGETMIRVGVRKVVDEAGEWLEVGRVRSKGSSMTDVAVARQRALIAEHAHRLYPLQVSTKDTLEWAYWNEDGEQWSVVDHKSVSAEKGVEKTIGFEGQPDPNTGFYCLYKEGRLMADSSDKSKL